MNSHDDYHLVKEVDDLTTMESGRVPAIMGGPEGMDDQVLKAVEEFAHVALIDRTPDIETVAVKLMQRGVRPALISVFADDALKDDGHLARAIAADEACVLPFGAWIGDWLDSQHETDPDIAYASIQGDHYGE